MVEPAPPSQTLRDTASFAFQERVRARFTDEEALQDGLMAPWHVRLEALHALAFQHRDAEIIEVALAEQDAPAVMDFALAIALPASPELVEHRLRMRKAMPSLDMAQYFPNGNFLYAEAAIMKRVASSPMRLQASVLTGMGLAGFTSAIPLLRRHAEVSGLRTRAQALAEGDQKAAKTEHGPTQWPERHWDGPSERAIAALLALSRLGAEVDVSLVRALHRQTLALLPAPQCGSHGVRARASLAAVLFEADAIGLDEACEDYGNVADLLTTTLRRGDWAAATDLAHSPHFRLPGAAFHFWPVLDFARPDHGKHEFLGHVGNAMYPLSRDAGVAPPPWWRWRSPWTRSLSSLALRGELGADLA